MARWILTLFLLLLWSCSATETGSPNLAGGTMDETETLLTGSVQDSLGKPFVACSVWVRPMIMPSSALTKVQAQYDSSVGSTLIITDASGVFEFTGMPEGDYALVIKNKESTLGVLQHLRIEPKDTLTLAAPLKLDALQSLVIPLDTLQGAEIRIPELGLRFIAKDSSLLLPLVPAGSYTIVITENGNTQNTEIPSSIPKPEEATAPLISWNADSSLGQFTDLENSSIMHLFRVKQTAWYTQNSYRPANSTTCNPSDGYLTSDCRGYGRYYSQAEAIASACPTGWHVPTVAEWNALVSQFGGALLAGNAFKATSGWDLYGGSNGNGQSSFAALAVGTSAATELGYDAYFWASDAPTAIHLTATSAGVEFLDMTGSEGLSVRCVLQL